VSREISSGITPGQRGESIKSGDWAFRCGGFPGKHSRSWRVAKEEVERLVRDAEANADEDKKRQEEIEVKNRADGLAYQTEKTLAEAGDKVPAPERAAAEKAIGAARAAVEGGRRDEIEAAVKELTQASHKLAEALYQQAAAPAGGDGAAAEPPPSAPKEGVVDAEVVDKG
jgi:molecular chaperone DnaK